MQSDHDDHAPASADRRALLQHLGWLLGAAALPASAVLGAGARDTRPYLDAAGLRLLTAVADTLVPRTDTPGAVQAGIPRLLDSLLRDWASAATRTQLVDALQRVDAAAVAQTRRPFAKLRPDARLALLRAHDAAALQPTPKTGLQTVDEMFAGPTVKDPAYARLKELVVVLYYSSKTGLTKELLYEHAPGKWQPSIPVTKDTRPFGGGVLL